MTYGAAPAWSGRSAASHPHPRLLAALVPVLCCGALGCGSAAERPETSAAAMLMTGPTRWLLLPNEERQIRHLRGNRETVEFIEDFWRRRSLDPASQTNEFARTFYERVAAADRLYPEGDVRGSLTDRGRALILLGPPPLLRYGQRQVPSWEPGQPSSRPAVHARLVAVETWSFQASDLAPALAALLEAEGLPSEVVLVFLVDAKRARLIAGEHVLDLAARAAVRGEVIRTGGRSRRDRH